MFVELWTGQDSFRAGNGSSRRNVGVQAFTRVGDEIMPLFVPFEKRLKGYKERQLVQTVPATDRFTANEAGMWFVNRYEIANGTEIMLEYRHKVGTGGFSEETEYLMLVHDTNAALERITLELPQHNLSSVPYVFGEGRFHIITEDTQLPEDAVEVWKHRFSLGDEYHLSDILDPNMETQHWGIVELEAAPRVTKKAEVVRDTKGKSRIRIKRTRNIRVRD